MDKWMYSTYLKKKNPELYKGKMGFEIVPIAEDQFEELRMLPVHERYDTFDIRLISTDQLQVFYDYINYLEEYFLGEDYDKED